MVTFVASTGTDLTDPAGLDRLNPADFNDLDFSHRTPTGFRAKSGAFEFRFTGNFTYDADNDPELSGTTVDQLIVRKNGKELYRFSDFASIALSKVLNTLGLGDVESFLGGADTLTGSEADDTLFGFNDGDTIFGLGGNDVIIGGVGVDTIDGGKGKDMVDYSANAGIDVTLNGSTLVDVEIDGSVADHIKNIENINGGVGGDFITGDSKANVIKGNGNNDFLTGAGGKDRLDGGTNNVNGDSANYSEKTAAVKLALNGASFATVTVGGVIEDKIRNIENVLGGEGNDKLTGDDQANTLTGNGGDDKLNGGLGADKLNGRQGNDTLTGGDDTVADTFIFDTALDAANNVDTITDFDIGIDKILLNDAIFVGLAGTMTGHFALNAPADGNDFIIYNTVTGQLFYDADGNGVGSAPVLFAVLTGAPGLGGGDFTVV